MDKLRVGGFILKVMHPNYLANVVMVKKSIETLRMCVDFTNLNKTCLDDSFPSQILTD